MSYKVKHVKSKLRYWIIFNQIMMGLKFSLLTAITWSPQKQSMNPDKIKCKWFTCEMTPENTSREVRE